MKTKQSSTNRKFNILAIVLAVITCLLATAHAGGTDFTAEIISITEGKKPREYQMILLKHTNPVGSQVKIDKPIRMVIHLRHRSPQVGTRSEKDFKEAINLLKKQMKKGGKFQFGIMGSHGGMIMLKGKKNEYQSNGLNVHSGIVFSHG